MVKSAIRDVWDEGKARMVGAASYWEVAGKSHHNHGDRQA
jgi:hypothetical protein